MKILYFRSIWGLDDLPTLEDRFSKIKQSGFDGVELDVPPDLETCRRARQSLDEFGLTVVAQQWRTSGRTVTEHQVGFESQYERALVLQPLYLNSHTGCDHFTLEENLALFDHATELADRHGMAVYHETHRGRALFSAQRRTPTPSTLVSAMPKARRSPIPAIRSGSRIWRPISPGGNASLTFDAPKVAPCCPSALNSARRLT